jgi:hypothetical protein
MSGFLTFLAMGAGTATAGSLAEYNANQERVSNRNKIIQNGQQISPPWDSPAGIPRPISQITNTTQVTRNRLIYVDSFPYFGATTMHRYWDPIANQHIYAQSNQPPEYGLGEATV